MASGPPWRRWWARWPAAGKGVHIHGSISHIWYDYLQTPMGRWLQLRDRYLHLLLEMQGITRDPICSMCTNTMEIKCDDCFGANYFCRSCCLDAHQRSPYHWTLRWTGNHFVPISLHELGFILYLGHHGTPCPNTYEVRSCHRSSSQCTYPFSGCPAAATAIWQAEKGKGVKVDTFRIHG